MQRQIRTTGSLHYACLCGVIVWVFHCDICPNFPWFLYVRPFSCMHLRYFRNVFQICLGQRSKILFCAFQKRCFARYVGLHVLRCLVRPPVLICQLQTAQANFHLHCFMHNSTNPCVISVDTTAGRISPHTMPKLDCSFFCIALLHVSHCVVFS